MLVPVWATDAKFVVSLSVATAVTAYAWYSGGGGSEERGRGGWEEQQQQQPPSRIGAMLRLFLVTFAATYVASFLFERVRGGGGDRSSSGGDASSSHRVITITKSGGGDDLGSGDPFGTVSSTVFTAAVPVAATAVPVAAAAAVAPAPAPKAKLTLADAMRHVDRRASPF